MYVDIGSALGYSLAHFIAASGSTSGLSPASLHAKLEDFGILGRCGQCGNCNFSPRPPSSTTPIEAYAIEGAPQNYQTLMSMQRAFFTSAAASKADKTQFFVLNYYVGNGSTEVVRVPSSASGEDVRLHDMPTWETPVEIAAITLDTLAELSGLRSIDVLNIEIGGDGPEVLEGATALLQSQRISIILLTYTKTGRWTAPHALKAVLDTLQGYGYYCFWAGKTGLVLITSCYVETYTQVSSGRIVCTPEKSLLFSNLTALIL